MEAAAAEGEGVQWEEVHALQAVFEERVQLLALSPITLAISVPITMPLAMQQKQEEKAEEGRDEENEEGKVLHLPPVVMRATLPDEYPEAAAPQLQFECGWAAPSVLDRLLEDAKALCEENQGAEVLFLLMNHVADVLQTQLEASPDTVMQSTVDDLRQFDKDEKRKEFEAQMQTCLICFGDVLGSQCMVLDCGHFFCRPCITQLAEGSVNDGGINKIVCPDTSCRKPIEVLLLRDILSDELYERWDQLTLSLAMDTMNDTSYCPRCSTAVIKASDTMAQCTRCMFTFCPRCQDAYHPLDGCLDPTGKLARLDRQISAASRTRAADDELMDRLRKERAELESLRFVKATSRTCPTCGAAISKTAGCNKIVCTVCHQAMCYRCGQNIQATKYEHFYGSACALFEDAEIQRWNEAMQLRPIRPIEFDVMVDLLVLQPALIVELRVCPTCKQRNLRHARNNHIRCWSCKKGFCGKCGAKVKKTTEHFGIVCPQHS